VPPWQVTLNLDTVLVDEAGCVPECAIPMLLRLRPSNLVLIGDHKQLQAFTSLVDPPRNHSRCAGM
jgi:superfamily I DNA and/or RNA helicase